MIIAKANKANSDLEVQIHQFSGGPFSGEREVDVVTEAIQWWKAYLDRIDAQR